MDQCSTITRGSPHLPPLIFYHGFMGAKEDWMDMLPFFEKRYHCIALDLPGHGATPYCEGILATLKAAVIMHTKPILIGYSMGGRIALQLQQSASAVVALSAHPGLTDEKEREARMKMDEAWGEKLLHFPFAEFLEQWYAQPIFQDLQNKPALLQNILNKRMHQNPLALAQVIKQLSLATLPVVASFSCPTLFIHGEEDLKYRELYAKLPKTVSVRGIKDCGHMVHLEKPQESAQHILNWLGSHANT